MKAVNIREIYAKADKNAAQQRVSDLNPILDKCKKDIEEKLGMPVSVHFRIKVKNELPSIESIISAICNVVDVDSALVLSSIRLQKVTTARHLVCYYAYTRYKYSLVAIATVLGRDHTSVIVARNKISAYLEIRDDLVCSLAGKCEQALNALDEKHDAE